MSATRESPSRNGRISVAPSEQLTPAISGRACSTETQNASTVCPERFRPLLSIAVNDSQSGRSGATSRAATIAAFAFRVSKIVSTRRRSTPPSASAAICSAYVCLTSSNVTDRKAASSTFGDTERDTFSGPSAPATNRGRSGVRFVHSSAAARASRAPASDISAARPSSA